VKQGQQESWKGKDGKKKLTEGMNNIKVHYMKYGNTTMKPFNFAQCTLFKEEGNH
jgi:hypothetical protein